MSATGRSDVRRPHDVYATPKWCVDRLLEVVKLPDGRWLEPAAGDGAIIRAVRTHRESRVRWSAIELQRTRANERGILAAMPHGSSVVSFKDALGRPDSDMDVRHFHNPPERVQRRLPPFDVIITNPPYSLAFEFAQHFIDKATFLVLLLRTNFLEGEERAGWLRAHMPNVYVLPNRPSFTGKGTDATSYAWMVWSRPFSHTAQVRVLDSTPLSERRR